MRTFLNNSVFLIVISFLQKFVNADAPQLCELQVDFNPGIGAKYSGVCRFNNEQLKVNNCKDALTVDVPADALGNPLFTYSCNTNFNYDGIWNGKTLRRNYCTSKETDCLHTLFECDADEAFRKACQSVSGGGTWSKGSG
jgi:hypothetical protein